MTLNIFLFIIMVAIKAVVLVPHILKDMKCKCKMSPVKKKKKLFWEYGEM